MKSLSTPILPKLFAQFHSFFPAARLGELWAQVQPYAYVWTLSPVGLIQGLMLAWLSRASGLRQIAERHSALVGTSNFSSLSPALARPVLERLAAALLGQLAPLWQPLPLQRVALDSMSLALTRTRRHRCKKLNDKSVGGGVLWAYLIQAGRGVCPVKVLQILEGAWSDVKALRQTPLMSRGPLYLMDRGFYALDLLERWNRESVHYIVRVKRGNLAYEPLRPWSGPRAAGRLTLEWDGLVRLGGPSAKQHPVVRLVMARLPWGEELLLASDQWGWSAEQVLEAYRQRWQIERFHKLLKDALGLAHLYNFSQSGLALQLEVAVLLAMLLFLAEVGPLEGQAVVIVVLRRALGRARAALGLGTPWRRNCCTVTHAKKKKKMGKRVWGHAQQNL